MHNRNVQKSSSEPEDCGQCVEVQASVVPVTALTMGHPRAASVDTVGTRMCPCDQPPTW